MYTIYTKMIYLVNLGFSFPGKKGRRKIKNNLFNALEDISLAVKISRAMIQSILKVNYPQTY